MSDRDVAIVDGGGANIASLLYALERQGATGQLTSDPEVIRSSSHVILPGVGAAAAAMSRLYEHQLAPTIANLEQPVLGICLGMQLLCAGSAEDDATCIQTNWRSASPREIESAASSTTCRWLTLPMTVTHRGSSDCRSIRSVRAKDPTRCLGGTCGAAAGQPGNAGAQHGLVSAHTTAGQPAARGNCRRQLVLLRAQLCRADRRCHAGDGSSPF